MTAIDETPGLTLGHLLRRRPSTSANRDYIREVADLLALDTAAAERVADYVLAQIELYGSADARLVMIVDDSEHAGTGPFCSWCWTIGGLCTHVAGRPDTSPVPAEQQVLEHYAAGQLGYLAAEDEWVDGAGDPLDDDLQDAATALAESGRLPRFAAWFGPEASRG